MKVLAFETSGPHGSVCLSEGTEVLSQSHWEKEKSHGEVLTSQISHCLAESNLGIGDIDVFAVGRGPGSFTGIRIAIASAKAFGYSTGRKVFAPNSLDILAQDIPKSSGHLYVVQNAFSGLVFLGKYRFETNWIQIGEIELKPVESLVEIIKPNDLFCGDTSGFSGDLGGLLKANINDISSDFKHPKATTLAHMALRPDRSSQVYDWTALSPLYIRPSAAEEKLKAGLLKPV